MTYCSECGEAVKVALHPVRNPKTHKRHHRALKDHDLCRRCYRTVMMQEMLRQHYENIQPLQPQAR